MDQRRAPCPQVAIGDFTRQPPAPLICTQARPARLTFSRQVSAASFPAETIMKSPMMLFDPDPVAAAILATQLRHAGFPTYVTPDGAAAISSAGRKQFAPIVAIPDFAHSQMRHCLHQIPHATPEPWLLSLPA